MPNNNSLPALFEEARPKIEAYLAGNKVLTAERMIALGNHIATTAFGHLRDAINDYPSSLVTAFLECADLGIEPNTRLHHAALVPFKNKFNKYFIQLIIQYQGLTHLAISHGAAEDVMGSLVYEDEIEQGRFYEDRTSRLQPLVHKPDPRIKRGAIAGPRDAEKERVAGAYSLIWLPSGKPKARYMQISEIEYVRKTYSRAGDEETGFSPWEKRWSEMALKTPLRANLKTMRLIGEAPKMQQAIELSNREYRDTEDETGDPGEVNPEALPPKEEQQSGEQQDAGKDGGPDEETLKAQRDALRLPFNLRYKLIQKEFPDYDGNMNSIPAKDYAAMENYLQQLSQMSPDAAKKLLAA